ncbi:transporter [Streptococcus pneumoniae]|uniref:MFS transporter n=1 Tax=Streptococcus pneumoniae TaxID=1313 RepID=UPI00076996E9|nr:MFS transporter [Streptococcus pneumoniae]MDS2642216.1 MFS transporter [Streptococcus pneumoniae]MDS2795120.1 MFS transporter [Streptococcus pneumoniae]MDS2981441.1 MFS transporter [Streptococcus pneumoniae]MDS3087151.1 MFS transporter [Streptococcus pneumoniae]MDS3196838.1 MFS transporter [Streptococcus pneumoniae]
MKNSNRLLLSRSINRVGNAMYDYANSSWITSLGEHAKSYLAIYQFVDYLTLIIFNPIAGVFADQFKRKKILLATDLICMLLCFCISFITTNQYLVYALIVTNIILAISSSFARTANKSFIPSVVDTTDRIKYNANLELSLQVISLVSPIISVYIYSNLGIRWALILNSLSFAFSFFLVQGIEIREEQILLKNKFSILLIFKNFIEGLVYIKEDRRLFLLLWISSLVNFFLACYNYLLPFTNVIYNNSNSYSMFLISGAIGSIIGAIISKNAKGSIKNLNFTVFYSGVSILAIPVLNFFGFFWLIFLANTLCTTSITIFNIIFTTQIQTNSPSDMLGRIFSTTYSAASLLMPLGTFIISSIDGSISNFSFILIGFGMIVIFIISQYTIILQRE